MADQQSNKLEARLGYHFADPALLRLALTHRGISGANNERLEFLGDAVLGMVVAELLYQRYPDVTEHRLSLMRANLVNREVLAGFARDLSLGEHLRLGQGELRSGGFRRDSILSNALEAVLGAIFIDGGVDAARKMIEQLISVRLEDDTVAHKDPKTRLQELMQARRLALPKYRVKAREGEAHTPEFLVECVLEELDVVVEARGGSRRDAEKTAAQHALDALGEPDNG